MLTHEALRKFVNEEKESPSLKPLPVDFFEQAKAYIDAKGKLEKENNWELSSTRDLLNSLFESRQRKIIFSALNSLSSGIVLENMTTEEQGFFESITKILKEFHDKKENILKGGIEVSFLQDIPAFVAPDMKTYGPFKKGEKAILPEKVVKLFTEKGAAHL